MQSSQSSNAGADAGGRDISRREFLTTAAASAVAIGSLGFGGIAWLSPVADPITRLSDGVIAPEPSLCIGCLTCEVACTDAHKKAGMSDFSRIRIYKDPSVKVDPEVTKNYPDRGSFFQGVCLQCPDAPCLPVCPVNALQVEPKTGARIINEKACIACGRCNAACPFDSRDAALQVGENKIAAHTKRVNYDASRSVYAKCDLCYFRPEGPACIEKCPINIRIKQGIIKSDRMCLDMPKSDPARFQQLQQQQTTKKA